MASTTATHTLGDLIVRPSQPDDAPAVAPTIATVGGFDVTLVVASTGVESLLLMLAMRGTVALPLALVLHVAVVATLAVFLLRRRREGHDLTAPLLALLAVMASGPIGALAMLPALMAMRRPTIPSGLLAQWYERISLSTSIETETWLADRVAANRTIDVAATSPLSFADVMQSGSLEERQRALGLVARSFHPSYLPMLAIALDSEEPVIRVQAAAVAARVRPRLATDAQAWSGEAEAIAGGGSRADAYRVARLLRGLDLACNSGLLDKPVEEAARKVAARLTRTLDVHALLLARPRSAADVALLDALETRLMAHARFEALRMLRKRRRLADRGWTRLRRLSKSVEAGKLRHVRRARHRVRRLRGSPAA